jgi:ribosomal protein S18 acetylase RimI-like enzyme
MVDVAIHVCSLSQIIVRPLTRVDLPALEWGGELIHFRRLFAQAYQQAELGYAVIWMAVYPSAGLVGQIFVQLNSHDPLLADGKHQAYIHGFRVRTGYRDQGIGSLLLQTAENDLIARDYCIVVLNVGHDNVDARRLYERHGYRIIGTVPGRWSYLDHLGRCRDVNEPAWRMEKKLG